MVSSSQITLVWHEDCQKQSPHNTDTVYWILEVKKFSLVGGDAK
jgi:hypothetical protein